jgi:hypothetical protein
MTWVEKFAVCGSQGDAYTVARSEHKNWGCSCPAWINKRQRQDCKHIKMVQNLLATNPKFKPTFEGDIDVATKGGPAEDALRAIILEDS